MILRFSLILWVFILIAPTLSSAAEPPKVLVSMAPIHSLVTGVMKGISTPGLLIKGGLSPHNLRLKPSQMRSLSQAEVIFWLGEEAESFLEHPLESASSNQQIIKILDLPKLLLLPLRKGGVWERDKHTTGNTDDTHHEHEHATQRPENIDSHVWLDPLNAKIITQAIADTLSIIDKERAAQYQENAEHVIFRLENLHLEVGNVAAAAVNKPFIVFHDAYQYFENRYNLKPAGSVTIDPDRKPGARRLREIQQKLQDTNAHCIFSESQFPSSHLRILTGDGQYYSGNLDPIGIDIPPGQNMYFMLIRRLVSDFVSCLCQIYVGEEFIEDEATTMPKQP